MTLSAVKVAITSPCACNQVVDYPRQADSGSASTPTPVRLKIVALSQHPCHFSPIGRRLQTKAAASHRAPVLFPFRRARAPSATTPPQSLHTAAVHPQTTLLNPADDVGPRHTASANSAALRRPERTRGSSK